jgi:TRAP-type C4-dicarboxylate transport system permease small subunit
VASATAAALLFGIFLVILAQVVFRYVLGRPLVWTEEAARYLYIWTCYLGMAMAFRHRTHIRIGALVDRLGPQARSRVQLASSLATLAFAALLGLQATHLAWLSRTTLAITFPLPWSAIYASAVVAAALLAVYAGEAAKAAWGDVRGRRAR